MPPACRDRWPQNLRESRQQMLKLRQLDLQLAFARAGALGEDVENQRRAVEDLAVENFFQVAALRRRKVVVENHRVHVLPPAEIREFAALPLPMNVAGLSDSVFCRPSPTTSPPAVAASSPSSASESRVSAWLRDLSSTPTRKTRSGRVFLVSMSAFNGLRRFKSENPPRSFLFALVQHAHVEAVVNDQRLRRDAVHEEHVAANRAAGADDGLAAENRRAGINRHAVLDGRMPFLAAQLLAARRWISRRA